MNDNIIATMFMSIPSSHQKLRQIEQLKQQQTEGKELEQNQVHTASSGCVN